MTQYQTLYTGVSRAAWGYIFLYIDFKLGTVSILPSFVGIFLFLSAIDLLKGSRRDLSLLRPLGILLAVFCCFISFCIMASLFDLRILFREDIPTDNPREP